MTPEEILAKVSSGELKGEELTTTIGGLSVDQQAEVKRLAAEDSHKSISEMNAIRKEKQRVEELITAKQAELKELEKEPEKKPEEQVTPQPADNTMSQFRVEQKQKAESKFKSDFGLSDDEMAKVSETFNKLDSGRVDSDLIYQDLVGAYAFINKDKLVEADKERKAREAAAATAAAEAAGGASGQAPNNGNEPPKYSDAVTQLSKEAGISQEAAQSVMQKGTKRVYG